MNNVILNTVFMIEKMLFFLFVTFASMCTIAYIWRVGLIREIRYYQGINSRKLKI